MKKFDQFFESKDEQIEEVNEDKTVILPNGFIDTVVNKGKVEIFFMIDKVKSQKVILNYDQTNALFKKLESHLKIIG